MKTCIPTKLLARIILLTIALAIFLPLTSLLGQGYLDLNDTDRVGLLIAGLKQTITLWQPGETNAVTWGDVSADGVIMKEGRFNDTLRQIINNTPQRSIRMANPLPGKFGSFWDFQLDFVSLPINGSQCDVPCTFGLFANVGRVGSGLIGLTKEGLNWRITRIDGLLPFLTAESQLLSITKKGQAAGLMPVKKRK
jgi:hypothetical protein